MNKLLLIIAVFLIGGTLSAQDYEFRVMLNKGDITMKSTGGSWEAVKTGGKLISGDQLKVGTGGFIGLLHKSGKTMEVKDVGEYNVDDLSANMGGGNSSVVSKYADFVMSKMSPEQREDNRRKYASVTGAVERATDNGGIKVMIRASEEIYSDKAIIIWEENDDIENYNVTIKNMFDEVAVTEVTSKNWFEIDFTDDKLVGETLIIFSVSSDGDTKLSSGDYGLKRLSPEDAKKFEPELKSLQENLGEESSLNMVILAEFFEQNNLIVDAQTNYVSAIQLSPTVDYYKEVYEEFKMRNNLGK